MWIGSMSMLRTYIGVLGESDFMFMMRGSQQHAHLHDAWVCLSSHTAELSINSTLSQAEQTQESVTLLEAKALDRHIT